MYQYTPLDQTLVNERVSQFRRQVDRYLTGRLSDDEFRPLRLMNGLYLQRHAYMLRVAIPYGLLSTKQLRTLAHIARRYDRGYGHFTTRQNIQYNWPELKDVGEILADLAAVEMHAIQTSGNCIRNVTTDHLAGMAVDELEDPRPYCEIMRQWSTFHPEFSYLPRKFKMAFSGATKDRAATAFHDIGYRLVKNDAGEVGFRVVVGGGQGRSPCIGRTIREFLPKKDLLSYTESILRVYNLHGNRDNMYKARIKILVTTLGIDEFRRQVEADWAANQAAGVGLELTDAEIARVSAYFTRPAYAATGDQTEALQRQAASHPAFGTWLAHNVTPHKAPGYAGVYLTLKTPGTAPGDATAAQMDAIADLADRYNFGEVRVLHTQNLFFSDVAQSDLFTLWQALVPLNVATPNAETTADMICCPGLDYCSLANASSIPVARTILDTVDELDYLHDIGELRLNISGCINACGHHHTGHIGVLGIDKKGDEWYQLSLGGSESDDAAIGQIIGPAFNRLTITPAIKAVLDTYIAQRKNDERFIDTYRRVGAAPFKTAAYAAAEQVEQGFDI